MAAPDQDLRGLPSTGGGSSRSDDYPRWHGDAVDRLRVENGQLTTETGVFDIVDLNIGVFAS